MHASIQVWVSGIRERFPDHFRPGVRVLEYGSRNINGGVRPWFQGSAEYVGIDYHPGPGVDWTGCAHDYEHPVGQFDVVITTETLEHDPYWERTLEHAVRNLRPGGLLVMTCAGPKRPPHNHDDSPTPGYYANLAPGQVQDHLESLSEWAHLDVHLQRMDLDLHCVGVLP